jgi:hypothetical protein
VATESLTRPLTIAPMDYPRAGMIDFLKLLGGSLVDFLNRWHVDDEKQMYPFYERIAELAAQTQPHRQLLVRHRGDVRLAFR